MPRFATPKPMKRPAGMEDCEEGESGTPGALPTRRAPQAGNRRLEAGGNGAVGGEDVAASPPRQ